MVLNGIVGRSSEQVSEIIFVVDGCTDDSEQILLNHPAITLSERSTKVLYANDVFETRANNIGLRAASEPYCMIIQDDMLMQEQDYDLRLLKPFQTWEDIFAVSGRDSHDNVILNGQLEHVNQAGKDFNTPRDIFAIRDSCNRGPLLLRHDLLEKLNYLDEAFAPQFLDDHDLCHRAYQDGRWLSGAYWVNFRSDLAWGGTRKGNTEFFNQAWAKNAAIMISRHRDALTGPKHAEDRILR